jgi:hypothetical protein
MSKRAVNRAVILDELSDEPMIDDPDAPVPGDEPEPAITATVAPTATVGPVAAPAIALTAEQLQAILASVLGQQNANQNAIASALQESVARARQKMPEDEVHTGKSTLNPEGVAKPKVRMPVWHGLLDPQDGKLHPLVPVAGTNNLEQMCSVAEIEALNTLRPTDTVNYELTDGGVEKVRVLEQKDGSGDPWRLIIVWPQGFFQDKDRRNRIGRIPYMVKQLTAGVSAAA